MNPPSKKALFRIENIDTEKEYEPNGVFKTLSPVIVERYSSTDIKNPKERYAGPIDADFKGCLLENIQRRYKLLFGRELSFFF